MKSFLVLAIFSLLPLCVQASDPSPYAGQETRSIKSLSTTEQTALFAGKGMGFAKAAELNGYPGPAHVLELALKLHLTDEQRKKTQALFNDMESMAKSLGAKLVDAERSLDTLFSTKQVTHASLTNALNEIGSLQAQLRAVHLSAHLDQTNILSAHQITIYNKLRGYAGEQGTSGHEHQH
jgi:Spy/CpxP family protein refolding chaperone